jgi:hypothetical protein
VETNKLTIGEQVGFKGDAHKSTRDTDMLKVLKHALTHLSNLVVNNPSTCLDQNALCACILADEGDAEGGSSRTISKHLH